VSETHPEEEVTRRDFLYIATAAVAGVGGVMVAWPLIHQMNPAANVRALATTEVDLSPVQPGSEIKILWQGKAVFVRNVTEAEQTELRDVAMNALKDPQTYDERVTEGKTNWLVMVGVCTHLGCVPYYRVEVENDFEGYFCPCHGSYYDLAGRILSGPAPSNLEIPPYEFTSDTSILIG